MTQSGGFFLHMAAGRPGEPSISAVLLALAVLVLVYGPITSRQVFRPEPNLV